MPDISETMLPGVGARFEFQTEAGEHVGVLVHRGGRREVLVYDEDDPDRCQTVMHLNVDETHALSDLLAASRVSEVTTTVEQRIEGLAIEWLTIEAGSPLAGRSIGDGMIRTKTGVSIVAVVRNTDTNPAPDPSFMLEVGDTAVAIGTLEGLDDVRTMLSS